MLGIRQKLMLGFAGLLLIFFITGSLTFAYVSRLGGAVDVILKENYISVIACQQMKESLERIDSGMLFTLTGNPDDGQRLIKFNLTRFNRALRTEQNNITLPGEGPAVKRLSSLFSEYSKAIEIISGQKTSLAEKKAAYYSRLYPLFRQIKGTAQHILEMNQNRMNDSGRAASAMAKSSLRQLMAAFAISVFIAVLFSILIHKLVLRPIRRLTESANRIKNGDLNLLLKVESHDEIGELSSTFNEMAAALRAGKREDMIKIIASKKYSEEVLRSLPEAVIMLDRNGMIRSVSETAEKYFGMHAETSLENYGLDWALDLYERCVAEKRKLTSEEYIQIFSDNRELFLEPSAYPVTGIEQEEKLSGAIIIMKDVTPLVEQNELKKSVVSTVSHQLKTPLTSVRMAVHLLLEEKTGQITDKQADLLMAARDGTERLAAIIDDLISINRFGSEGLNATPCHAVTLVSEAYDLFISDARDKDIEFRMCASNDLPDVYADRSRIAHVFSNLISNALRFTSPGGTIRVEAGKEGNFVKFSVTDSGSGIPEEHLKHIFDQFYRVPGQSSSSGAGLGLSIVREIIESHGGTISVMSRENLGSEFSFTLPVVGGNK